MSDPIDRALAEVTAEVARADGKASGLLAALALPAAVLPAVLPGRALPLPAAIAAAAGAVALIGALLAALAAIRPSTPPAADIQLGCWLHWRTCTPEQIADDLTVDRRTEHIGRLSVLAHRKFTALRWAVLGTRVAVATFAAAALITLI